MLVHVFINLGPFVLYFSTQLPMKLVSVKCLPAKTNLQLTRFQAAELFF